MAAAPASPGPGLRNEAMGEVHLAAQSGDLGRLEAEVERLVGRGLKRVDFCNARAGLLGTTALHLASEEGHEAVVEYLLNNEADGFAKDGSGVPPIHLAAIQVRPPRLPNPRTSQAPPRWGVQLCGAGAPPPPTALPQAGADRPLPSQGHASVVRALGKWNPRFISSLNKAKETPLHWAAAKGKTPMVKLLLEMGAWRLCDSQSDEGWTPLHHAAANGHFQTVEVLVQRGTKMNTQNNKGNTPLHIASSNGQAGIVDFLVKKGARSDIKNNEGRTAAGSGKSAAVNSIMEPEEGGGRQGRPGRQGRGRPGGGQGGRLAGPGPRRGPEAVPGRADGRLERGGGRRGLAAGTPQEGGHEAGECPESAEPQRRPQAVDAPGVPQQVRARPVGVALPTERGGPPERVPKEGGGDMGGLRGAEDEDERTPSDH